MNAFERFFDVGKDIILAFSGYFYHVLTTHCLSGCFVAANQEMKLKFKHF